MRHSNTSKTGQQQPAPAKRGFFAAAGERLKRAMSGARAPDATEPSAQEPAISAAHADGADSEVTTSVQAKARDLLQQDRTRKRTGGAEGVNGTRPRRTTPPPLPSQRVGAEPAGTSLDAISGKSTERPSTARPKRAVRNSKSEALRARLGAAKAALAEAQAKRAAEPPPATPADDTKREIPTAASGSGSSAPSAAEAISGIPQNQQPAVPATSEAAEAEPIRTLTIARLLARQGYFERSLSIYDQLLSENAGDTDLRAEADRVRAQHTGEQPGC
jgi:hypothetical protein